MKFSKILFMLLIGGWAFKSPALGANADLNWLKNGDFATQAEWKGEFTLAPGPHEKQAAYLQSDKPKWKEVQQTITLPQPLPPVVELSGWMKSENVVQGPNDWDAARVVIDFYKADGKLAGNWQADVARLTGTHDWELYDRQYIPPKDAVTATVEIQLSNCTGMAWVSGLRLLVYDLDLKPLAAGAKTHPGLTPGMKVKSDNWILNGDFERPGSKDWTGSHIAAEGHESAHSLLVKSEKPTWNMAEQIISLGDSRSDFVTIGFWAKTEGLKKNGESYAAAEAQVNFLDANGGEVPKSGETLFSSTETTDWTYYGKKIPVPAGAAKVWLRAGLSNCVGNIWFDDFYMSPLSAKGQKLTTLIQYEQSTDTSDWYAYRPGTKASDTPLDLSFLNDKPAGKHGFVTAKDGHFEFADGTRVRFWGTDAVGPRVFIDHAQADLVAERLAKLGVNLLRLHAMDHQWGPTEANIFDPKADNTQVFSADSLDKLDYFIAALKRNGIYVHPDWAVSRVFRPGDQVPAADELENGAKGAIHFDRRLIELNQKYAQMLLTHVNPYTGMALKDDPVYFGNEIVNESSIFTNYGEQALPKYYWEELQKLYEAWGGKGKMTRFRYDSNTARLLPTENVENADASMKFLLQETTKTNLEMKDFLRKLSPHALLSGSNMGLPILGNVKSDSVMDFVDSHAYWDHPQIWKMPGSWAEADHAPMNNNAQMKDPLNGSLVLDLSRGRVEGKPYMVTEWNDCFPNEYRIEGPVLMAAYGCLQDWDGLLQFDFGSTQMGAQKMINFDINSRVENEPLYQASALIFRLGLLKPSSVAVLEPLSDKAVLANGMKSDLLFDHPWLPFVAKVAKKFTGATEGTAMDLASLEKRYSRDEKEIDSSTGEETLKYGEGTLKIDSPCAQGLVGAIGNGQVLGTEGLWMRVSKRNPWAGVLAVSLDHQPLKKSVKLMVFAVGRAENSGQVYNATRTALRDPGHLPVLLEGVQAEVSIAVDPSRKYRVTPVDESGKEGMALKTTVEHGGLKFNISPQDHTAYYLVSAQVK